jgi:hypothetical protein
LQPFRPGDNNLFLKIWNRDRLLFGWPKFVESAAQRRPQNPKNVNPNFFARNPLISLVSPKKKFGKICKVKTPALENKGIFWRRKAPNRAKPRHPKVLQGF